MELYGRRNGDHNHQQSEWIQHQQQQPGGPETGLEESMRRLGLLGGRGGGEYYPERPGMADCAYYMRTGTCGYGNKCRYNHPPDRGTSAGGAARIAAVGAYPERPGEPPCQYYLRTGTCKFGASCKFHHPRQVGGSSSDALLNIYGYPLRSEKEVYHHEIEQARPVDVETVLEKDSYEVVANRRTKKINPKDLKIPRRGKVKLRLLQEILKMNPKSIEKKYKEQQQT